PQAPTLDHSICAGEHTKENDTAASTRALYGLSPSAEVAVTIKLPHLRDSHAGWTERPGLPLIALGKESQRIICCKRCVQRGGVAAGNCRFQKGRYNQCGR